MFNIFKRQDNSSPGTSIAWGPQGPHNQNQNNMRPDPNSFQRPAAPPVDNQLPGWLLMQYAMNQGIPPYQLYQMMQNGFDPYANPPQQQMQPFYGDFSATKPTMPGNINPGFSFGGRQNPSPRPFQLQKPSPRQARRDDWQGFAPPITANTGSVFGIL